MAANVESSIAALSAADLKPLYLVSGDLVVAEPVALRLAEALGEKHGTKPEVHRRPAELAPLFSDLKTFSLFSPAKILVAVETAVLADRAAAAELIDQAGKAGPVPEDEDDLTPSQRRGAARLLQALALFKVDPYAGTSAEVLSSLPDWAYQGGSTFRRKRRNRGRGKAAARALREDLERLLERARAAELKAWAEDDAAELAKLLDMGLPKGHALVLVESAAAPDHPVVAALTEAEAFVAVGAVVSDQKKRWEGVELLVDELERETGSRIARDAAEELARRTLRGEGAGRRRRAEADSTSRFAAEFRKLSAMAGDGQIGLDLVGEVVADRGEEDVWRILDAVGRGRAGEALARMSRLMRASHDPVATRLSLFSLLAEYAKQLSAIGSLVHQGGVRSGETSYARFRDRVAPELQADVDEDGPNPLAGLHPYRLHRAYLAASKAEPGALDLLPVAALAIELELKGESRRPDAALSAFVGRMAAVCSGR